LLQHADTLQAKQPTAPSRAAVGAWRAVCERQWEAGGLPMTLQAAAEVLDSIQPSAAGGSSEGVGSTGVAPVWAMQECWSVGGHFGASGQVCHDAGVATPAASSSSSSSRDDSSGPECGLSAALGSEPILSIGGFVHKATALSALCLRLASDKDVGSSSGVSLVRTLLATAAAAVSLRGAAAQPLVSAAVAAAMQVLDIQPTTQQPAKSQATTGNVKQPQPHGPAASVSHLPSGNPQPAVTAAASSSQDELLLCLSLAADLTKAVLQLEREAAGQPSSNSCCSLACVDLLQLLLECMLAESNNTGAAMQLRQLQTVAYTLQLVEAAGRAEAVWVGSASEDPEGRRRSTAQQRHRVCYSAGFAAVRSAAGLLPSAAFSPALLLLAAVRCPALCSRECS
jgi:hypothetical protein